MKTKDSFSDVAKNQKPQYDDGVWSRESKKKKTIAFVIVSYWTWTRNGLVCRRSSPPGAFGWKKRKTGRRPCGISSLLIFFSPRSFLVLARAARGRRTPRRHLCRSVGISYARRFFAVRKKTDCVPTTRPTTATLLRDELDTKKGHWVIGVFWRRPRLRYIIYQHVYIPALTDVQLLIGGPRVTYWLATSAVLYPLS